MDKKKRKRIEHWHLITIYLVIYDIIAINFSYLLGLWLRFDVKFSSIPAYYLKTFVRFAPIYTIVAIIIFFFCRLYNSIWRFASFSELNRIIFSNLLTTIFHIVGITLIFSKRMPISYYVFGSFMQLALMIGIRFSYRYINLERARRIKAEKSLSNAMIIGAGSAGLSILREIKLSNKLHTKVRCIIDDNSNKWGRTIEGTPIVGGRDSIMSAVEKYSIDTIFFAIANTNPKEKRDILNICKETNCDIKTLPGLYQLANGEVSLNRMKPVAVEDLLGREPIKVNMNEIYDHLRGKTILVTGGGGSIGSELCRQIAAQNPKLLIIFDIYENTTYDIEQELKRIYGDRLNLKVLIGSVRDVDRINSIFEEYRPELVYHAAAHKHVPLMENSPNETIKNNVMGTYNVALAALKFKAERFVLISTDKAVNPTNIMGASKRLCEMIIQSMDAISRENRPDILENLNDAENINIESKKNESRTGTQFVAVRFGNVLGSNGSVIPLFKKQIAEGGPVTVTHPDIVRYFMTIPEAVSLVLQAGVYAWGGEIFVLDMGDPVKIDTLARNLIKLSGLRPDEDIEIKFTGLRSGEKLYEEKLMAEEGMKSTENEKIHIGKPIPFDLTVFLKNLKRLDIASKNNSKDIVSLVEEVVDTFNPVGSTPTGNENYNKKR